MAEAAAGKASQLWRKYGNAACYGALLLILAAAGAVLLINLSAADTQAVYINYTLIIAAACFIFAAVLLYVVFFTKCRTENKFLLSFLLLGLVYNFVITPLAPPDEAYHWEQAYKIAKPVTGDREYGGVFFLNDLLIEGSWFHENRKEAYKTVMETLFVPENDPGEYNAYNHGYAYPLQYIPSAIGIIAGKALPLSNILQFYIGRLTNLAFSAVLLYFSFKIAPKFKINIIVIAMLPMFLHQSASYSYDSFINSMSIMLTALIMREIYSTGKLQTGRLVLITVAGILLAPAKYVYSLLIVPLVLIPAERFNSRIDRIIKTAVPVALVFTAAVIGFYTSATLNPLPEINWEGHRNYTNAFIVASPLRAIRVFIDTTVQLAEFYIRSCFGQYMGGMSLYVEEALITAFILLYFLMLISLRMKETDMSGLPETGCDTAAGSMEVRVSAKMRMLLLAVPAAIYTGTLYAMFVGWTSDIHRIIQGVQGRYFIPLLLPLAIALSINLPAGPLKKIAFKGDPVKAIIPATVILNILVIFDVLNKTITG